MKRISQFKTPIKITVLLTLQLFSSLYFLKAQVSMGPYSPGRPESNQGNFNITGDWLGTRWIGAYKHEFIYFLRQDQVLGVRIIGQASTDYGYTWRYIQPHLFIYKNGRQASRMEVKWINANQFVVSNIEDGDPNNRNVTISFTRYNSSAAPKNPQKSFPNCIPNGVQDGDEQGVDCGGSSCPPCPTACSYCKGTRQIICGVCNGAGEHYDSYNSRYEDCTACTDGKRPCWNH